MIRIGIGVEGPSDKAFWEKVLHRSFPGFLFTIITFSGKTQLARMAPDIAESFRSSQHRAAFFLVDADEAICATETLKCFDESFRAEASQQPAADRFVQIAVAIRELESWVLADEKAIQDLFDYPEYRAPQHPQKPSGKGRFLSLCRERKGLLAGLEDREFAAHVGSRFSPTRARKNSPSFDYFWGRLTGKIESLRS